MDPWAKTKRNHGLEHATISLLLLPSASGRPVAGYSIPAGFLVLGDIPTQQVEESAHEALRRMQAGEGSESTVEYGVTTAASVAKRFLDSGRNVGAVISGAEQIIIPADSGITQLGRIFQALALIEPGTTGGVQETSDAVKNQLSSGASIVLITPAPPAIVSSALDTLWATGASVVPVLLDAPSFKAGSTLATQMSGFDAYVIRMGDEIGNRLDYRSAPPGLAAPAQELQGAAR